MSSVAKVVEYKSKKLSEPLTFVRIQHEYLHDRQIVGSYSFNITTKVNQELELVWLVKCTTFGAGTICKWLEIVLEKSEKSVTGNFEIQTDDGIVMKNDFDSKSLPFTQILPEFRTRGKITITFGIYFEEANNEITCPSLIDDYDKLYESKKHCDVVFIIGEEEIPAHKLIISARSKVFAAMFDSDMIEKKTGRVEIVDVEPAIFKKLLRFIYCGKVESKDTDELLKLTVAANKYSVLNLVSNCATQISHCLSVENAVDVLIIADQVNIKFLKKECIDLIIKNKRETFIKNGYEKLRQFHTDLVCQLCDYVMEQE